MNDNKTLSNSVIEKSNDATSIQCTIVGDAIRTKDDKPAKTQLINLISSVTQPTISQSDLPISIMETTIIRSKLRGKKLDISLHDTSGTETYDRLRPIFYNNAQLIILLYALDNKPSFENLGKNWFPEIKHHAPHSKLLLVGLSESTNPVDVKVSADEAKAFAKSINAVNYVECNLSNPSDIKKVYNQILIAIDPQPNLAPPFFDDYFANNTNKDIQQLIDGAILVAQGRRQRNSAFSLLPDEIILELLMEFGKLTVNFRTNAAFNPLQVLLELILGNVPNVAEESKRKQYPRLQWSRTLFTGTGPIDIFVKSTITPEEIKQIILAYDAMKQNNPANKFKLLGSTVANTVGLHSNSEKCLAVLSKTNVTGREAYMTIAAFVNDKNNQPTRLYKVLENHFVNLSVFANAVESKKMVAKKG